MHQEKEKHFQKQERGYWKQDMTQTSVQMPKWSTVKEFLECPLCLQIYRNPHQLQCGHKFCEVCIYTMNRNREIICPLDGKRISPENAVLDAELQMKLESVLADCPLSRNGCNWHGHVIDLEEHKLKCIFAEMSCPKGCGKSLLKKDVASHAKTNCVSSFSRCRKCYIEMASDLLQNHECPCERYTCPEGCGKKDMTLEELRRHQNPKDGLCNSAKINCRFASAGCNFMGTTREMCLHLKDKSEEHTDILCSSLAKMTTMQKGTEERLEKQADQLKTIQETFCQYAILLKEFEKKQRELLEQVSEQQEKINDQALKISAKDQLINQLKSQLDECHDAVDELKYGSQNGNLLWKICNFRESLNKALSQKNFSIYSPVIFTSKFGYKLCAQLFPAGSVDSSDRYMSIYFHLLQSEHDDVLRWPFANKISFTLLDQAENTGEARNVSYTIIPAQNASSYQKPNQKMSEGRGCHQFVSLQELESRHYIKNDSIFIKIKVLQRN